MAGAERMTIEEVVKRVLVEEQADVLRAAVEAVCAELMEIEVVRHEALLDRAGCETSPLGCRSSLAEAEDSLIRETPGRVGSSPDNDGARRHCQTARVRQARPEGVREKPACKAP